MHNTHTVDNKIPTAAIHGDLIYLACLVLRHCSSPSLCLSLCSCLCCPGRPALSTRLSVGTRVQGQASMTVGVRPYGMLSLSLTHTRPPHGRWAEGGNAAAVSHAAWTCYPVIHSAQGGPPLLLLLESAGDELRTFVLCA